jgi:hypothetical protein
MLSHRIVAAWKWIGENDKQLLVCFAFIGGFYALFEYWSHQNSDQEQEVAKYVVLQGSPQIATARSKLELLMNAPEISGLTKDTYASFFEAKYSDAEVLQSLIIELNFFDSLSICVESERCSRQLACKYFFADAEGFLQNFRPLLAKLQVRDNTESAVYLKRFAHTHCESSIKKYCASPMIHFRSVDCVKFRPPKYV